MKPLGLLLTAFGILGLGAAHAQTDLTGKSGITPILGLENGTIDDSNPVSGTFTDSGNGAPYAHNGNTAAIADGNPGTAEDTYYYDFGNSVNSSYVGFSIAGLPDVQVSALAVSFRLDGDGGWFGVNGDRPGGATGDNSTKLSATYLVVPDLQVTYDNTNWVDVSNSNNYLSVLENYTEGGGNTTPVTFTLDVPVTGIEGIRLVGTNGGIAGSGGGGNANGGKGGFLAVDEETLSGVVPEPSTYAMVLGGMAFLGFFVRRKCAIVV